MKLPEVFSLPSFSSLWAAPYRLPPVVLQDPIFVEPPALYVDLLTTAPPAFLEDFLLEPSAGEGSSKFIQHSENVLLCDLLILNLHNLNYY